MTGTDLLTNTLALLDETDTTSYLSTVVPKINLVLAETFDLNNRIRHFKDKEPLTDIPVLSDVSDALTYETDLLYRVLPLGLVGRIYVSDENIPILSMYKQEYENAIRVSDRFIATSVYHSRTGG